MFIRLCLKYTSITGRLMHFEAQGQDPIAPHKATTCKLSAKRLTFFYFILKFGAPGISQKVHGNCGVIWLNLVDLFPEQ